MTYRFKILLIAFSTKGFLLIATLGVYFLIAKRLPNSFNFQDDYASLIAIGFAVLVFLPLVEMLELKLRNLLLSEYLAVDPKSSRNAYKHLDIDGLVKTVFPDIVRISGSSGGRLALLNEENSFDIYTYTSGRQRKVPTRNVYSLKNQLLNFLKDKKEGVKISETFHIPEINSDFIALHSEFLIPFLFRERIFGFVALTNIPNQESLSAIQLLVRSASVSVHNHLLASHLAENLKYRQEIKQAERIQNLLQISSIPKFDGLNLEPSKGLPELGILLDFFYDAYSELNFLIVYPGTKSKGAGILLSHLMGKVFAREYQKKITNFLYLREMVSRLFEESSWKEKYEILIGKLKNKRELEIYVEGSKYAIQSITEKKKLVFSEGWKSFLVIPKDGLEILHNNNTLLRIQPEEKILS